LQKGTHRAASLALAGPAAHFIGPWVGGGHWDRLGDGHWRSPFRSAESTLAERFAQGDIDEEDYRARRDVLRANAWPQPPVE